MEVTRRFWAVVAAGLVLVGCAALFARPVLLIGGAGVGAWLLARQYLFVRAATDLDNTLAVEQSVTPDRLSTDTETRVTLEAVLSASVPLDLRIVAAPPVGTTTAATRDERTVTLPIGERDRSIAFTVSAPVAGTFTFDPPTVEMTDRAGLFRETIQRGSTPTLTVEPRVPENVHVGVGGDEIPAAFGEHDLGRRGSGIEPAALRRYVMGDAANRIDWKATARLDEAYVREYEAQTDRTTVLLVDHREGMAQGPEGETKLDYAREIALSFLTSAREADDPLGLYAVGNEGLTDQLLPASTTQQYTGLDVRLRSLAPTGVVSQGSVDPRRTERTMRTPAETRTAGDRLSADDSAFGAALRPYFSEARTYVTRTGSEPLLHAARTIRAQASGSLWTVILTDDSNRAEVRKTVKLARGGDDSVLVFLTPSILFEAGGLRDLETAYDRYREFEEFRRSLAGMERVGAFEVGPGDRLAAILESHRDRRRSAEAIG